MMMLIPPRRPIQSLSLSSLVVYFAVSVEKKMRKGSGKDRGDDDTRARRPVRAISRPTDPHLNRIHMADATAINTDTPTENH
jgi:hypothetical protein